MTRGDRNSNNHDMFEINKKILRLFEDEYKSLPALKKKMQTLENKRSFSNNFSKLKNNEEIKKIKDEIQLIESGIREANYIHKTETILNRYKEILNEPIQIDFMTNKILNDTTEKDRLMSNFLKIAKNYIEIEPIITDKNDLWCDDCNMELYEMDDQLFVCKNCGYSVSNLTTMTSYQDSSRINSTQRYVYERKANFINTIKEFQGVQNTTIQDKVREDLQDIINMYNLTKDKITKDHIYDFLRLTNHTDNYKDINLLYTEFTGRASPDIQHLERVLLSMFDQVDEVYQRLKSDRSNFLNGQFILFKFLQQLSYPCKEEDFYILKTREKKLAHDEMWKKICEELGWVFIPTA